VLRKIVTMKVLKILYLILFSLVGTISVTFAQQLEIQTKIDTNRITLGDQIGLHYLLDKEKDIYVTLPLLRDTLTPGVEILGDPVIDSTRVKDGMLTITLDLLITSFDTGIYYIPPQSFIVHDGIYTDTMQSDATYLEVFGVAIDTTYAIRDIKGQEGAPVSPLVILSIILGSLIVLGIAGYLIYYFFIRKKEEEEGMRIVTKPSEPAYIAAFRELDRIKAQKLWQQNKVKEYYTRITYIIRWYIWQRFGIPALEETSDEILTNFGKLKVDNVNMEALESLLTLADMVKFAKGNPDPDENIVHLDNAYDFVKKTRDDSSAGNENPTGKRTKEAQTKISGED
jgi:hypothetical protein